MPTQSTSNPASDHSNPDPSATYLQGPPYAPPAPLEPLRPPHLTAPDLGADHRRLTPGLLPAPASYALHPRPVFQAVGPGSDPQPRCSVSPLMIPPAGVEPRAAPPGSGAPPSTSAAYLGQEILSSLKPGVPSVNSDLHKPTLAPSFLPSALVPPQSFREPMGKSLLKQGKEVDVFSQPPNLVRPMPVSSALSKQPFL